MMTYPMSNPLGGKAEQDPIHCTIVIPAYNEAERIPRTLDHILDHACERQWPVEVIVVDDGSTDITAEVVSRYAARSSTIRLIKNPVHRGKGHCVRTGVMNAAGHVILITDADLPAFMEEAPLLLQVLAEGADIAIGSRWLRPSLQQVRPSFLRRNLSRCFNLFVRCLLGLGFKDTQCGFKAFTSRAASLTFRFQTLSGWAFDAELLVIAKSLGLTVKEVPIRTHHDARSKLKPLLHSFQILSDLLRVACCRLCARYPSPVAPCLLPHARHAGNRSLWSHFLRTPAAAGLAGLALFATSMLMRDIDAVAGSTVVAANYSAPASPIVDATQNPRYEFQNSAQDAEPSSLIDEFDDSSDQE